MRCRTNSPAAVCALLVLFMAPAPGAGQLCYENRGEILSRFAGTLEEQVRADGVGGITAGVAVGRDLVWGQGFGWADAERSVPAGVNSIYRVGSISKSFTGVLLLQMVERRLVGLDDPVVAVLPELAGLKSPPEGAAPVSFRHLASHTAGLVREPALEGATSGPLEQWEDKLLASIPTTSFDTRPGERYAYSNIGFGILGYSLSRAAGVPFMELVAGSILRPLGMNSSGFVVTPEMSEDLAVGYQNGADGRVDRETPALEHVGRGYKVPNGGIYSTVGDLARFMAGLSGKSSAQVLGADARRLIGVDQTPTQDGYSLGFRVWEGPHGSRLIGHTGSVAGYTAFMAFEPESGLGVVLLRNYNQGATDLGAVALALLREMLSCGTR
ncbi:MAG TPA: serine hydrolase domain-containing protein [Longimicrobiales bacterium]|nr:serine hydrolase domain-containing protein [Longimicrobiales bacterium]